MADPCAEIRGEARVLGGELPLVHEVVPAPEPWEAFRRLADLPRVLFLDGDSSDPQSRYSYIAAAPFETITWKDGEARLLDADSRVRLRGPYDPLRLLAERLSPWSGSRRDDLPPFQGGAAGALGYGLGSAMERLPPPLRDDFGLPDLVVGLYDWVVSFDRSRGTCHVVAHGFPAREPATRASLAQARIDGIVRALSRRAPDGGAGDPSPSEAPRVEPASPTVALERRPGVYSNFTREGYLAAVRKAVEYVRAGDIFQVNLSQRLLVPQAAGALAIYARLRRANPAPFSAFLALDSGAIASTSPEHFLTLRSGRVLTRPIKGTRPRGATPEEDERRRRELLESPKDRSENVMIVDLLRNDLSRVARLGSVKVPRLFCAETHPTVHHLVSEVTARLRPGLGPVDLLRASFPGGSISGAPKIRALEIIAELEPHARGFYCGCLGWIGFDGDAQWSILIRTATIARGWVQMPVGGGIVAASDPASEYDETLHKAEGMLRAFERAEHGAAGKLDSDGAN